VSLSAEQTAKVLSDLQALGFEMPGLKRVETAAAA
jgi:hypothetical protein